MTATQPEGLDMTNSQWLLDMMGRHDFTIPSVAFDEIINRIELLSASKPAATEAAHSDAPLSLIPDLVKLNETAVSTALLDMGDAQMKWRAEVQIYREITPLALSAYSDGYEAGIAAILCALGGSPAAPAQSAEPVAYFVNDNAPGLKPHYSQISEQFKDHEDVFAFYSAPQPSPTAVSQDERIDQLERALVYVAHTMHGEPQYMLAEGITLGDVSYVRVQVGDVDVQVNIPEASARTLYAAARDMTERKVAKRGAAIDAALNAARPASGETE